MLFGAATFALALLFRGESRITFPNPVGRLTLSTQGNYLVAGAANSSATWLSSVRTGSVLTQEPRESIVVSSDERFAAGMQSARQLELTDLESGKTSMLPYLGPCIFSPNGHAMAFMTKPGDMSQTPRIRSLNLPPADLSITLFEPETATTTNLSKYGADVNLGSVKPTGVRLSQWRDRGIEIEVSSPFVSAAFVTFFVDPKADRASLAPSGYSPANPSLIDGGLVDVAAMPDGMAILSRGPGADYRFLFDRRTAGEPLKSLKFALASRANRAVVWSLSAKGDEQSLWLVNTVTAQAQRLVRAPFDGQDRLAYSISGDGEKIAIQSPDDPRVAIVKDAPRL